MKISTLLRKAANEHLWDGETIYNSPCGDIYLPSCIAVTMTKGASHAAHMNALDFLRPLGVNTRSSREFDELDAGPIRQGARFLWLHFAALVAEDEGL